MSLPVPRSLAPMEARIADELPIGPQWQYELKWDGFRCLAFRDEGVVDLRSKSGQPLGRYFPELVSALAALRPRRFVIDSEIVVPTENGLSFDALLQRVHPAQSRIDKLSAATPAAMIVFDLLVDVRGNDLTTKPLSERRQRLEAFAASYLADSPSIRVSPMTRRISIARDWLAGHKGTDGVMAKRLDLGYASGERTAMLKIKRKRTADCVVGGFRYATRGRVVGSLLLGLYDDDGILHHVGFTSSLTAEERRRITPVLERLSGGEGFTGQAPGGPSRWSTERSSEWEPLSPKLVVEVGYDHFSNGRFRHGTKFLRWRPEKAPSQCLLSQVAEARGGRTEPPRTKGRPGRAELTIDSTGPSRRPRSSNSHSKTRRR